MSLEAVQYLYYSMGVVFMTLFFLGLLIIVILIIAILAKINKLQKQVNSIVTGFKEHPGEKAAEAILEFGSKIIHRKEKSEKST